MIDYEKLEITPAKWPDLEQLPDKKWRRIFSITFESPIASIINLGDVEQILSTEDFNVKVKMIREDLVEVYIITEKWGWETEISFGTSKIIKKINSLVGKISTVQGQKRNDWCSYIWE
jgi:hypothetical protein